MILRREVRKGAVLAESALIYPILFMLVLGVILLGLGVVRYQQVSHITREASRWASVHGAKYGTDPLNTDANKRAATPQDVYDNAIVPYAAGMQTGTLTFTTTTNATDQTITYTGVNDAGTITYSITWHMDANGNPDKNPTRLVTVTDPATGLNQEVARSNTVTVTITYAWNTGLFGSIPVTCTSVNAIFY
jgi:Flp pilus assembly protein TadG